MPQCKERESDLDKCLSPYLSIIYRKPIKYSMEYSHLFKFGYVLGHILETQGMRAA